ncbi:MAG: hypothetical protein AMXMBFR64_04660 [Myxococcales bacterium]
MSEAPAVIGIDLGTTNSAVAWVDTRRLVEGEQPPVRLFEPPQLVRPGAVETRPLLPSFVYAPGEHDLPAGSTALPWDAGRAFAVGELARDHGALVPGRLVASAKSWLCHDEVDRQAAILPWGGGDEVKKLSPVDASARVLAHVREAWDHVMAKGDPDLRFERQEVIVTVPASFDEVARELTLEAARRAGLERVTLLEEPQAAFYCWIQQHHGQWGASFPGGLVLVCDIGGGTTDLSLISATTATGGVPAFERVAVGAHLLLGGDNLDLALARVVEQTGGGTLDARQWTTLSHRCRVAKELLLADEGPDGVAVTVPGSGSRVIGGARKVEVTRELAERVLLDGFFPLTGAQERVGGRRRGGIQEFGLPYVQDPAVSRHVAAFLAQHAGQVDPEARWGDMARPDAILFNGGTVSPRRIQERVVSVLRGWFPVGRGGGAWEPRVLANGRPDLAVAYGAAYYGLVRRGHGLRIAGGSPRAYYVGVGASTAGPPPVPGSVRVVCLLPHGIEEGRQVEVGADLHARTNAAVRFPLWSSNTRMGDQPGDVLMLAEDTLAPLPPLHTLLRFGKKGVESSIPVKLQAQVTEVGTLALFCASLQTHHRWKLEFDLRAGWAADGDAAAVIETEAIDEARVEAGRALITACFGTGGDPAGLVKELEKALDAPRDEWPLGAIRALWPALRDAADGRRRSAAHEARWLNLAGHCLRPGTGMPGDEIRIKELWRLASEGVTHRRDSQPLSEWWVLWRRVAAGLSAGQQVEITGRALPLVMSKKVDPFKYGRGAPDKNEEREIWYALASLERIERATRLNLGETIVKRLGNRETARYGYWVLARVGARVPLYGPVSGVLPPDVVGRWVDAVLEAKWHEPEKVAFEAVQLGRLTGDRARDLPAPVRKKLAAAIEKQADASRLTQLLMEVVPLERREQVRVLGDSIPPGLVLAP